MRSLTLLVVLSLAACSSGQGGGSLIPVKAVGSVTGESKGPQVFVAGVPVNALVRVQGNFSYTVQATPPYLTYDGDYTIIVEPLPGREAEAQYAVSSGAILIRRAGVPSALNAPGTIAATNAARAKAAQQKAPGIAPAESLPPPLHTYVPAPGECPGGVCTINR